MSKARNERRRRQRDAGEHTNVLAVHLSTFYEFLSSSPKPSDEAVRETFVRHRNAWYKYCASHQLTESVKDLFTLNVEKAWKRNQDRQTEQ